MFYVILLLRFIFCTSKGATNHEIAKLFTNNYANELKMGFVDKNKIQLLSGAEKPISGYLAYNQATVVISRILNYNKDLLLDNSK